MELCYRNNTKSLFRKYAFLITALTKYQLFRDYVMDKTFKMPQEKLSLLLPNGYHERIEKNRYRMIITPNAIYSRKLYPALFRFDSIASFVKDAKEAMEIFLWLLKLRPAYFPSLIQRLHFAQSTFNPDANPETTSVDGTVSRAGVSEGWGTIRAGAGTAADDLTASPTVALRVFSAGTTPNYQEFMRIITLFDSSSLPDGTTITSATYELFLQSFNFTAGYPLVSRVVTTTPASNTALVAGDYGQLGTVAQAPDKTEADLTTGAFNAWTLNAIGRDNISKTGITKFGIREGNDADNVDPGYPGNNVDDRWSCDFAESTNDPKLVVDYTIEQSVFILQ